jgi:hypothetical protein
MKLRQDQLTLREALASNRLEAFVRQEEARGVEFAKGSELERALALLITRRRIECALLSRSARFFHPEVVRPDCGH